MDDVIGGDLIGLPARHKLDVHAYHRMAEAGIFRETDRIELIEGDLIDMAPIGQGHAGNVNALTEALFLACAGRAIVSPQNSVCLDDWSEPQPDLAILRRRADFYTTGDRPGPADTLLLVEVADSAVRCARTEKLPLYARAGVPEFWIVDLQSRVLDAYRTPQGENYRDLTSHVSGDTICLAAAPEIVVNLTLFFS